MYQSAIPEICWPAVLDGTSASLASVLLQLESSQWWSHKQIADNQFRQLSSVIEHTYRTVPFYRQRLGPFAGDTGRLASPDAWQAVPLLSRREIQSAGDALHSTDIPRSHGRVTRMTTSGSTSQPVETLATKVTELFWRALTLREHFWHQRDFSQSFAAIRHTGNNEALPPDGCRFENWGSATAGIIRTGPVFLLNVRSSIEQQVDWLARVDPAYVLSYPSVLLEIAKALSDRPRALSRLRQLRTFGEILEPHCRATCERAFGVPAIDMYSSQEVGYLAIQCPNSSQYHVMSENVLVEILDDDGKACEPGQIGRVVVTTLHNFAMPLLRYDIGDYAEVGQPCACGRGLPTLRRILGRQRNLLVMPDGTRRWPVFDAARRPANLPPLYQFQVVQHASLAIELKVVRESDFSTKEAAVVIQYIQQMLEHPFDVTIRRVDAIPRSPTGKFEDFICQVP